MRLPRYHGGWMLRLTLRLTVFPLALLCSCTSISGVDNYVFDGIGGSGATHAGGGGSGGTGANGGGGEGGKGGEGGEGGDGGASCTDERILFPTTDFDHVVPPDVSFLHVKAWGGGGNQECTNDSGRGGVGGFTEAIFTVTPGTPLIVIVGRRKTGSALTTEEQQSFGFPGQGAGGLSGLFEGPAPLAHTERSRALIIAGGGGGAGALAENCNHGHPGNSPTNAGGQLTMLGDKGNININSGGGGYAGGNGGSGNIDPGFGGTWYVKGTALSSSEQWGEAGDLTVPGSFDPDYEGDAGAQEKPGLVVLHYLCDEPPPL